MLGCHLESQIVGASNTSARPKDPAQVRFADHDEVVPADNSLPTKLKEMRTPRATDRQNKHAAGLYHKRLSRDSDLNAINTRIRRPCDAGRGATKGRQ